MQQKLAVPDIRAAIQRKFPGLPPYALTEDSVKRLVASRTALTADLDLLFFDLGWLTLRASTSNRRRGLDMQHVKRDLAATMICSGATG